MDTFLALITEETTTAEKEDHQCEREERVADANHYSENEGVCTLENGGVVVALETCVHSIKDLVEEGKDIRGDLSTVEL